MRNKFDKSNSSLNNRKTTPNKENKIVNVHPLERVDTEDETPLARNLESR
jgi:hypothetical protein